MKRLIIGSFLIKFGILISGCSSTPPNPVLPDGSHRVPINRELPVQSVPSAASGAGAES
ncbi:hypothetical protein [Burkholderia pseudomultivorans]|uniref:hypothetical protein n=1 Tax=Burkholderia pseudomultivorans TaxID=1207504 RepID=UPI0018C8D072|nr:hypothetical protein [Burkholderia pseudomultivorans]